MERFLSEKLDKQSHPNEGGETREADCVRVAGDAEGSEVRDCFKNAWDAGR